MKRLLLDNLKNIPGWRTRDKLVVFSIDDYCNVRLNSTAAREELRIAGLNLGSRFDQFDALETRQDLEALFDVLSSVSDACARPAIFTAYALCANPDFEAISDGGHVYQFEPVPRTFERLSEEQAFAYDGAWALWQEGVRRGMLRPQFHGREHLNVELLERKLKVGDKALIANLENRSMAALDGDPSMPGVRFTQAFGLWDETEVARHRKIIESGLSLFAEVFGFASRTFTPPSQALHPLFPRPCAKITGHRFRRNTM